ncbi:hypothetical protein DXG03_004802 [Asterophora parasitica]|uniref:Nuclear condensin complex subunit 3 C-terminal domain-containing protein n=1 Tax=Asterophora parasitica TaxID=117018 RepID=A0A9P7G0R7_9AGAR|nr:hypothetical protein DXG03_004802 [Asterophora parasitica]
MPGRTLQAEAVALRDQVNSLLPRIVDQAQNTTANHQKNLVALHKLQAQAAQCIEHLRKGKGVKLIGERIFEEAVFDTLMRVLSVKKGVPQADRVVKFVGQYIKFINEKAVEEKTAEEADEDDEEESTASRFTARLLNFLLKGLLAKEKSVRYRVLQTVAEMVSHLGEIDEDIYKELRSSLMGRINDKEANVRVQAVIALSKLAGSEGPSEVEDGESTVLDVLLDTMEHDSSPEVRRAALLNITVNSTTLPRILDRTRDTDTTLRKLVYSAVLERDLTIKDDEGMGPTHPRACTILQRELIIRNGLSDREPSVRNAAASLLGKWVDIIAERPAKQEGENTLQDAKIESGLVEMLKMLDLAAESTVAADAVLGVFDTRPDIFENMEFGRDYWENLTPETAFLARVFVEHGKALKDEARLENVLPVVTELAFRIQTAFNTLIDDITVEEQERLFRDPTEDEIIRMEDSRLEKEAIIGELLRLAVNLDYADEIGRRKMFQLVRDMLSHPALPESLLSKCLDVLRELSANERDLIRVVVEIVQDLRDLGGDEDQDATKDADAETTYGETPATVRPPRTNKKPPTEQIPEEKAHSDFIDLRSLSLCIGMLERVNSTLEENSTLDGILKELIVPSVKRKEPVFREKGLRLAVGSVLLFVTQLMSSPEVLMPSLLKVVFDILMVHDQVLRKEIPGDFPKIVPFLIQLLGTSTSDKVRALICVGLSKLVLAGMITDNTVVMNLVQSYLSPATIDNQELRQCLTFFFPAYSYSSPLNQRTMREIFIKTYQELSKDRKKLQGDDEMISSAQVTALFLDWTDPIKLRSAFDARGKADAKHQADMSVQLDMAVDIIKSLLQDEWEKEDKKILCQLLGKLHIPETVEDDKIKELKVLMFGLRSRRPLRDTTTNNAFAKFEANIAKKFEKQLEDFSEEEYRKLEQLEELFKFLDDIIPEDDEEAISFEEPRRKGKKRRPRLSKSDDNSSGEDVSEPGPPLPPTRTLPKRSAAAKKTVIEILSDSDEEQPAAVPVPRDNRSKQRRDTLEVKEEQLDAEINEILDDDDTSEIPFDSIMDGDMHEEEEEEEEVNDLLAEE